MTSTNKYVYRVGPGEGVRRHWAGGQTTVSGGRHARQGFYYYAFKGWPITTLAPSFSADLTSDIAVAESELQRLNNSPPGTQLLEAVARQLLRAEAVASSRIEGLILSHKKLAEAAFDPEDTSVNARTVLGNVHAMEEAIKLATSRHRVTVEDIRAIHRRLFEGSREVRAGAVRTSQSWIGTGENPWGARFIPVPEEDVAALLEDLCVFLERDDLPAVVQAALAHAQFETIHPFEDGNGRVGRALIHLVLRRRGVAPHYVPPISLVLASNYAAYESGLTTYRERRYEDWAGVFSRAVTIACRGAEELAGRIERLKNSWRESAKAPRRGSAADRLIDVLPVHPVVDVRSVQNILQASDEAARLGIERLQAAGVLEEITKLKRGRAWECVGLFALLDQFERKLAENDSGGQQRPAPRPTKTSAERDATRARGAP
ncbi:MAG: Fic family protein [Chloroflexota bacterium]|nr:Fic family protein [Chloroflexota bacterium]